MEAHAVIVGASAAGVAAAEGLRNAGYTGRITLVGAEPQLPYDRPPLSKQILMGSWPAEKVTLRSEARYAELGVELRLGSPAGGVDPEARKIWTLAGDELEYTGLIIATGAAPRRLPCDAAVRGVHVLRTLDDAEQLRRDLTDAEHVVVAGAGVLGAEVAAVARTLGAHVTLAGDEDAPMHRQVGATVATRLAEIHSANGVELQMGRTVDAVAGTQGRVSSVRLSDGRELPADVVVTAIGCVPTVNWLASSGFQLGNGVHCDAYCRVQDSVYAAGDVASWHNERFGHRMRVEHRVNATEQGAVAGRNLAGANVPFTPVPYFWSDQYQHRIQVYGQVSPDAAAQLAEGSLDDDKFVVTFSQAGRLTAAVGCNLPKSMIHYRQQIIEDWRVPGDQPSTLPAHRPVTHPASL